MCSYESYLSRTHDVIDDVARSQSRFNFENALYVIAYSMLFVMCCVKYLVLLDRINNCSFILAMYYVQDIIMSPWFNKFVET